VLQNALPNKAIIPSLRLWEVWRKGNAWVGSNWIPELVVESTESEVKKRRVRVRIRGMVQGVCFRAFARDAAVTEGVAGWVRNLRDGSVEALFEGDADSIERMIAWCRRGSPYGHVDQVDVKEEVYEGTFDRFEVTYSR
jgi:acylphosphatase